MTHSMTAFARCESRSELGELIWEIRSVNHRYLETSVRMPEELRMVETAVREKVGARLSRGKVDCGLRYRPGQATQSGIQVNLEMAKEVINAGGIVGQMMAGAVSPNVMQILQWPGVVEQQRPDMSPVMKQVLELLDDALVQLLDSRRREGEKLSDLILQRCEAMRGQVKRAKERIPQVLSEVRERLRQRLGELQDALDATRLEQEVVLLAQRLDVDEEMDRLMTQLDEIEAVVKRSEPIGRRLDFLMQELNREANTLSSKSSDVEMTQCAVEMKVLIEQMREQVQNIE